MLKKYAKWVWMGCVMASIWGSMGWIWAASGFYFEGQLWDAASRQPVEGTRNVTIELMSGLVNDGIGPGTQLRWSQRIPYQFENGLIWVEMGRDIPLDPTALLAPNAGVVVEVSGVLGKVVYPIRPIPNVAWSPLAQQTLSVKSSGIQGALLSRSMAGPYPQIRGVGPLTGLRVGGVVVTASPPRVGIGVGVPAMGLDVANGIRIRTGNLQLADGSVLKTGSLSRPAVGVGNTSSVRIDADGASLGRGILFRSGQVERVGVGSMGEVSVGEPTVSGPLLSVGGGLLIGSVTGGTPGSLRFNASQFWGYGDYGWVRLDVQPTVASSWILANGAVTPKAGITSWGIGGWLPSAAVQVMGPVRATQWEGAVSGNGVLLTGLKWAQVQGVAPLLRGGLGEWVTQNRVLQVTQNRIEGLGVGAGGWVLGGNSGLFSPTGSIGYGMVQRVMGTQLEWSHVTPSVGVVSTLLDEGMGFSSLQVTPYGHVEGVTSLLMDDRYPRQESMDFLYAGGSVVRLTGSLRVTALQGTIVMDRLGVTVIRIGTSNARQRVSVAGAIRVSDNASAVPGTIQLNRTYDWVEGFGPQGWRRLDSPANERAGWQLNRPVVGVGVGRVGIATANPSQALGVSGSAVVAGTAQASWVRTSRMGIGQRSVAPGQWQGGDWSVGELSMSRWSVARPDMVIPTLRALGMRVGEYRVTPGASVVMPDGLQTPVWQVGHWDSPDIRMGPFRWWNGEWGMKEGVRLSFPVEMPSLLTVPRLSVGSGGGGDTLTIKDRQVAIQRPLRYNASGLNVSGDMRVGMLDSGMRSSLSDVILAGNVMVGGSVINTDTQLGMVTVSTSATLAQEDTRVVTMGQSMVGLNPPTQAKWVVQGDEGQAILDWQTNETGAALFMDEQGRMGIGMGNPTAFLSVREATDTIPAWRINPGSLLTQPLKGSVEITDSLYFTPTQTSRRSVWLTNREMSGTGIIGMSNLEGGTVTGARIAGVWQWPPHVIASNGWGLTGGNVGINQSNPQTTLDVGGAIRLKGTPMSTGSIGFSGGVLVGRASAGEVVLSNQADRDVWVLATDKASAHTMANMGIMDRNPQVALSVMGTVSATQWVGRGSGIRGLTNTQWTGMVSVAQGGVKRMGTGEGLLTGWGGDVLRAVTINQLHVVGMMPQIGGVAVVTGRGLNHLLAMGERLWVSLAQPAVTVTALSMPDDWVWQQLTLDEWGHVVGMSSQALGDRYVTNVTGLMRQDNARITNSLRLMGQPSLQTTTGDLIISANRVGVGTTMPSQTLAIQGAIRMASANQTEPGTIRYQDGRFEGHNDTTWLPLDVVSSTIKTADFLVGDGSLLTGLVHDYARLYRPQGGLDWPYWVPDTVLVANQDAELTSIYLPAYRWLMMTSRGIEAIDWVVSNLQKTVASHTLSHLPYTGSGMPTLAGDVGIATLTLDSLGRPLQIATRSYDSRYYQKVDVWGKVFPVGDQVWSKRLTFTTQSLLSTEGGSLMVQPGGRGRVGWGSTQPEALVSVGDEATPINQAVALEIGGRMGQGVNQEGIKWLIQGVATQDPVTIIQAQSADQVVEMALMNRRNGIRSSGLYVAGNMAVGVDEAVQDAQTGVLNAQAFVGDGSQLTNIGIQNISTVASPIKGGLGAGSYPVGGVLIGRGIGSVGGIVLGSGDLLIGTGDLPSAGRLGGQTGVVVTTGRGRIQLALPQSIDQTSRPTFNAMGLDTLIAPYWYSEGTLWLPRRVSFGAMPPEGVDVWVAGAMNARQDVMVLKGVSLDGTLTAPTVSVETQLTLPFWTAIPAPMLAGVRPMALDVTMNVVGSVQISGSGKVSANGLTVLSPGNNGLRVTDRVTMRDGLRATRVTVGDVFRFKQDTLVVKASGVVGIGREVETGVVVSGNMLVSGSGRVDTLTVKDPLNWMGGWFRLTDEGVGWGNAPVSGVAVSGNVRGEEWVLNESVSVTQSARVGTSDWVVIAGKTGVGKVPQYPLDVSGDMTVSDRVVAGTVTTLELAHRSQRLVVTTNRVGIGVAVPTAVLDVMGNTQWRGIVRGNDNGLVVSLNRVGIGTSYPSQEGGVDIQGTAEAKSARAVDAVGTQLTAAGLWSDPRVQTVGVASSNPNATLGIQGNARITQIARVSDGVSTNEWVVDQPNRLWQVQASGVGIKRPPTEWLAITGKMTAKALQAKQLTVTQNVIIGDESTGIMMDMRTQQMGIGMMPTDPLSVSGNMSVDGQVSANQWVADQTVSVNTTTLVVTNQQVGMGVAPQSPDTKWEVVGDVMVTQGGESRGVSLNGAWRVGEVGRVGLWVNPDEGRVGISTHTPGETLSVSGNTSITGIMGAHMVTAVQSLQVGDGVVASGDRVGINTKAPAATLDVMGTLRVGRVTLNQEWVIRSTAMVTPNQGSGPVFRVSNSGLGIRRFTPLNALDVDGDGQVSHHIMGDRLTVGGAMKVGNMVFDQEGIQLGSIPRDGKTVVGQTATLTGDLSAGQMTGATQWVLHEVVTVNPLIWSIDAASLPLQGMGVSGNMWVTGRLQAAQLNGDGSWLTNLTPVYPVNTNEMAGLWQGVLGLTIPKSGDIPMGVSGTWRPHEVTAIPQSGVSVNRAYGRVVISLAAVNQFSGMFLTGTLNMNTDPKLIYDGVNGRWSSVGIGTTEPLAATLDVKGSGRYGGDVRVGALWLNAAGKVGVATAPVADLDVSGEGRLSGALRVGNRMVMGGQLSVADGVWVGTRDGQDRVGIGTTEPAHRLDVRGDMLVSGRLWGAIPMVSMTSGVTTVFEARNAINLASLVSANRLQTPFWVALTGASTYQASMTMAGSMAITELKVGGKTLWVSPNQTIGINQSPVASNALTVSGDMTTSQGVTMSSLTVAKEGDWAQKGVVIKSDTKQWQLFHHEGVESTLVGGDVVITGPTRASSWEGDGSLLTSLNLVGVTTGYWGRGVGGIGDVSLSGMLSEGSWRWLGIGNQQVETFGGALFPTTQTVGWRRDRLLGQIQLTLPQLLWPTNQPTFNQLTLKTSLRAAHFKAVENQPLWLNVPSVGMGRVDPLARLVVAGDAVITGSMMVGSLSVDPTPFNDRLLIGNGPWQGGGLLVNGSSWVSGNMVVKSVTADQWVMNTWAMTNPAFGSVGIGRLFPTRKLEVSGNVVIAGGLQIGTVKATTLNTPIATLDTLNSAVIRNRWTVAVATLNQFEIPGVPALRLTDRGDVTVNILRGSRIKMATYELDPHMTSSLPALGITTALKSVSDSFDLSGVPGTNLTFTLNEVVVPYIAGPTTQSLLDPNARSSTNTLVVTTVKQGANQVVWFPETSLSNWNVRLDTVINTTASQPANANIEQQVIFSHPQGDAAWLSSTVPRTTCPVSQTGSTYSGPTDPRWDMPCLVAVSANVAAPGFVTASITSWPTANHLPPVFGDAEYGDSGSPAWYPLGGIIQARDVTVNVTMNQLVDGQWVPVKMPIIQSVAGVQIDQAGGRFELQQRVELTQPGAYALVVPEGVTELTAEVWGGGGGAGGRGRTLSAQGNAGADGGKVGGTIAVSPGQVITLYVGGGGWGGMDVREAIFVGRPDERELSSNSVYLLAVGGGGGVNGGGPGGHSVGPEQGGTQPRYCDANPAQANLMPYSYRTLINGVMTEFTSDYYLSQNPPDNTDTTFRQSWGSSYKPFTDGARATGTCPPARDDGVPAWRTGGGGGGGGGWSGLFVDQTAYLIAGGGGGGHGGHALGNASTSIFREGTALNETAKGGGMTMASSVPDARTAIEMAGDVGRSFYYETDQSIGGGGGGGGGAVGGAGETWDTSSSDDSYYYCDIIYNNTLSGCRLIGGPISHILYYVSNAGGSSYTHPNVREGWQQAGASRGRGELVGSGHALGGDYSSDTVSHLASVYAGNYYKVVAGSKRKGGDGKIVITMWLSFVDPDQTSRGGLTNATTGMKTLGIVNQSVMYNNRGYRPFDWVNITQHFSKGDGLVPHLSTDVCPIITDDTYKVQYYYSYLNDTQGSGCDHYSQYQYFNLPCVFANQTQDTLKDFISNSDQDAFDINAPVRANYYYNIISGVSSRPYVLDTRFLADDLALTGNQYAPPPALVTTALNNGSTMVVNQVRVGAPGAPYFIDSQERVTVVAPKGYGRLKTVNVDVLSKTSGSFDIPHPLLGLASQGGRLRHYFVETPSPGGNVYKWQGDYSKGESWVGLPGYMAHLNDDTMVQLSPVGHFGDGWGEVRGTQLHVVVSEAGRYNVLLFGTRKDPGALDVFNQFGTEYRVRDDQSIERIK